jgi:four helix bundle protein
VRDFRRLAVLQRAHSLTLRIYKVTSAFPKEEVYGLTSQLRRSAASIPANIAEGCGREGDAELGRFLYVAMGSANELEYHLILARDLGYFLESDYEHTEQGLNEVKRMLSGLISRVRADRPRRRNEPN